MMDTDRIRALAAQLREQAVEIDEEARRLLGAAEAVPWQGLAAEAMRDQARRRTAALQHTARLHQDAADALERHAGAVDRMRAALLAALAEARELAEDAVDRVHDLADDVLDRLDPRQLADLLP